jgi:hypothetical protein
MKVDKNQQFNAAIPVRLEIASRLMEFCKVSNECPNPEMFRKEYAMQALANADALINAHNDTCEEPKND